jgi:SprA-related family
MLLQTTLRLAAATPVTGPPAVRAREEREPRPIQSGANSGDARSRTQGEQAAILHFGAQSVDRAQTRAENEAARTAERDASAEDSEALSHDEQQALEELQRRDREVRTHEQTHRSVGGQYAGNIHLDYQVGPDGERYAVSGSTPIDVSAVPGDPIATLRKMEVVQRAASAPASPSGADRQVAAHAAQQAQHARAELAAQRYGDARELAREGTESRAQSRPLPAPSGADIEAAPGRLLAIFG